MRQPSLTFIHLAVDVAELFKVLFNIVDPSVIEKPTMLHVWRL